MLTQHELKQLLHYDPTTGHFTWLPRVNDTSGFNAKYAGKQVYLKTNHAGYSEVRLFGKRYVAHRVAYTIVTGAAPPSLDHINGVRTDNRWCNLRPATAADNARNRRTHMPNGAKGVKKQGNRYRAVIGHAGSYKCLGTYDTLQEAAEAYDTAALSLHGEFASTNSHLQSR